MSQEKDSFFKAGILISTGIHFFIIIFFPLWRPFLPSKPQQRVIEVSLINIEKPEKIKQKVEIRKVPGTPPRSQVEQVQKGKIPKLSPVKVSVSPSRDIPVALPRARIEEKTRIPLPTVSFQPPAFYRGEKIIREKGQAVKSILPQKPPLYGEVPHMISSPLKEEVPSFTLSQKRRPGEDITSGVKGPVGITFKGLGSRKPERTPYPSYPPEMERKGVEGQGEVRIYVTKEGQVVDVEIIHTSGWHDFDEEVRSALLKWKFTPVDEPGVKTYEGSFYFRFTD